MRKIALGLFALTLAAGPALAQSPLSFADVDADGDGFLSFVELQAVWPDLTQEEFDRADTDSTGALSPDQLATLQPSTMPAPEAAPVPPPAGPVDTLPAPTDSLSDDSQ
jgi:hypothetical protein